jgi:D-aminoacyl-tRNA deacylase
MKLILYSEKDLAGQNIKNCILSMVDYEEKKVGDYLFYDCGKFGIVEIKERLIYADFVDERLSKYLNFHEILFASRHSSKDGRKILTVHTTGNVSTADFGGKPYSVAMPAPNTMKNYALWLKDEIIGLEGYEFTMEATHHGPSEIKTPSAFYEIGSTEEEWKDEAAAMCVAKSMLRAIEDERQWRVALGIGGTHYAPRQTELLLETVFSFSHIFAKYTFQGLSKEFLTKVIELDKSDCIIYDDKSTTSDVKKMLSGIAEELGIEILKAKHAKKYKFNK